MKSVAGHKTLGVVFIALVLIAVALTYGQFTNKFASWEKVTLQTSKIGLQLPTRADVKARGVIVGEVLDFTTTAEGAELTLGIFPDSIDSIPANVTGAIEPKTLFGEKYVALVIPEEPATQPLAAGADIARTDIAIEVEEVLADLHPLLRTVQPAELNKTLNALATALEGRGNAIGDNLETLDAYLKRMNPQIEPLVEDLRLTAQVSDLYASVVPEIAETLRNSIVTMGTLEAREDKLNQLFNDVAAFSDTGAEFLDDNGDNMIRLGKLGAQQLRVLAKYAPQYPCLLGGIVGAGKLQAEAFRGFTLHINLELLPNQPRGYGPQDKPRYGAKDGPYCGTLPNPPYNQDNPFQNPPDFDDGVDEPTGKGTMRTAPAFGTSLDSPAGFAGSEAETELLKSLIAPALGVGVGEVPDLGVLLVGPMARGAEVSLR
ncbi:MCE family protein [Nocardioides sp.]|uniref:MCE family protein n=1 Tax=Nocardioides sp. TaxID=35761 RepID=UPI0027361C68|nr:MCE family protein [Nocardioides sp.]MDP3894493.1 MCE family protein [Nocardioides sp.]